MQISTFPVCHVYFFPFNNFVQCLASFFFILSILVLLFFILRFFSTLYYFLHFICLLPECRPSPPLSPPAAAPTSMVAASLAPAGRRSLRSGLPCTMHESASLHRPHISPPLPELPTRDVGPADPPPPTPPPSEARRHRLPPGKVGSCQGALAGG
jgi:hypothetical protein